MRPDQQQSQTSLRQAFEAGAASTRRTAKPSPRLTLRFTEAELERLQAAATDMSLSAYVRKVLFSSETAPRKGRSHRPVADQEALARVLGLLGHGWRMPAGLIDSAERDPLNFSRAEWQQARRTEQDARALKALFQECWAASDSAAGFMHALDARGLMLARGDRRGVVAVDFRGEVYAVARWAGIPTKAVRARFGDGGMLKPVAEVRAQMAARLGEKLTGFADETTREFEEAAARLEGKRRRMVVSQRGERRDLADAQARRNVEEARERSQRLRRGLLGIWDRVVGRHAKMRRQNDVEVDAAARRDAVERQALIDRQLANRRELRNELRTIRSTHLEELTRLEREIADTNSMPQTDLTADVGPRSEPSSKRRRRSGPSL